MNPEQAREPTGLASRTAGVMMLTGGLMAGVTVLLPPRGGGSEELVIGAGALAATIGLIVLLAQPDLPEWALGAMAALGTILITIVTDEGAAKGVTGTAEFAIVYVWVCLFAFYFLHFPHALAQLALIGAAFAWLLNARTLALDETIARWLITMSTLLVAGLLIARLRGHINHLVAELSRHARRDSLTLLLNRRALEERSEVEFARLHRHGGSLAILVADLDDFKEINDGLGHPAGDRILKRVAEVLERETREVDAVSRVGGDEFAILLPGVTAPTAEAVADRLRVAVRRSAGDAHLRLSLSVGVAVGPDDGDGLEDLWQAADRAMYEAKRSGGDAIAGTPAPTIDACPPAIG